LISIWEIWRNYRKSIIKFFIIFASSCLLIFLLFFLPKIYLKNPEETTINLQNPSEEIEFSLAKLLPPVFKQLHLFANSPEFPSSINLISESHWNRIQAKQLIDHLNSNELLSLKTANDSISINLEKKAVSPERTYSVAASKSFPTSRDPWKWPFDPQSIWNLSIGSNAVYTPANIQSGEWTSVDVELLFQVKESDPLTRLYAPGSWTHRCSGTNSPTGNPSDEIYIRFPEDKIVPDANPPHTPNNAAAILQPDGETILSLEPLARCTSGGFVYGWHFGEENIYGLGITGSHGGSGLSTLGGSIRLGELVNDEPIRHALKVNLWGKLYLNYNSEDATPGYRWPAYKADSAAPWNYGGTNPQLEMGALLALPPDLTPESLGISSIPALKIFYALQDYGAYVVDDTGWNVTAFNLQEGVTEEFLQTYGYEFETSDTKSQWFQEYYTLVENLHIVTNNQENSIGGGGERRAPLAPAFASASDNH
jgi:hypothetical protein